eukprot:15566-Heterococcus_DN1.PRE.2
MFAAVDYLSTGTTASSDTTQPVINAGADTDAAATAAATTSTDDDTSTAVQAQFSSGVRGAQPPDLQQRRKGNAHIQASITNDLCIDLLVCLF